MTDNPFDALRAAINHAKQVRRACEAHADTMAALLEGNLRSVSPYKLERLKRELRDFNMHTGKWRKRA